MCDHPINFNGLCGVCGEELPERPDYEMPDASTVHILHGSLDLQVTLKEAERVERGVMERLLASKKLSLVIDLDQTVLHATMDPSVEQWMLDPAVSADLHRIVLQPEEATFPGSNRSRLYAAPSHRPQVYYVKFRPELRGFLEAASGLFELHVYTMGSRQYARACTSIIDPHRRLFYDRILSRDDVLDASRKCLKRIFPHSSRLVLVLDDRGDVWEWCGNLVPVRPFVFFEAAAGAGPGGLQAGVLRGRVDGVVQGALADTELNKDDVAVIVGEMRKSVLAGCVLAFSGVFPSVHQDNNSDSSNDDGAENGPRGKPDIVRMAEAFGAIFQSSVTSGCTHVICSRAGSDKHRTAVQMGIPVVSADWLWQSVWAWSQQDTDGYLLGPADAEVAEYAEAGPNQKHPKLDSDSDDGGDGSSAQDNEEDLLDWLDNGLASSGESIDSDNIYGHSPLLSVSNYAKE